MQDQDLHIIVRESMELIPPAYDPAHWELMRVKLDQELPPPPSGLGIWKLFGLGLILVAGITAYYILRPGTSNLAEQTEISAQTQIERQQKISAIAPSAMQQLAPASDSNAVSKSGQEPSIVNPEKFLYQQATRHKRPPLDREQFIHPSIQSIYMEYGKSVPLKLPAVITEPITKIQLFYTDHPKNFDHQKLNAQRIKELIKRYPELSKNPTINWELIAQEITEGDLEASQKFHGFLIHSLPKSDRKKSQLEPITTLFNPTPTQVEHSLDTYLLEQSIIRQVRERIIVGDSTTFKVLERNKSNWKNVAVVCDWSSSMFPYGTQVFTWLSLNQSNTAIKGYVFFNDCDSLGRQIISSETPGKMFFSRDRDYENVLETMVKSVRKGVDNKDLKENDLEALLFTLEQFDEVDEIVLIADNVSPVRYPQLIDQIDKPVRIILCGKTLYQDQAIQHDYLELAKATNGSIHTIEDDLDNLDQIKDGTWIKVGDAYYKYRNGQFIPSFRKNRPKGK